MFTAPEISDPKNIDSFLCSLVLPIIETYKYRREVKTFIKYTATKAKRFPHKIKLKCLKFK